MHVSNTMDKLTCTMFPLNDNSCWGFCSFWVVETKKKRRRGTGLQILQALNLIQALSSTPYHTSSASTLDANRIHNCLCCHSHLAFALIHASPSVGHTVPVYLNAFTFLFALHENAHCLKNLLDWYFVFNLPI